MIILEKIYVKTLETRFKLNQNA